MIFIGSGIECEKPYKVKAYVTFTKDAVTSTAYGEEFELTLQAPVQPE